VDVTGVDELVLKTLKGDRDNFCDHTDWADARLIQIDKAAENIVPSSM
jgi:hypothetical protein